MCDLFGCLCHPVRVLDVNEPFYAFALLLRQDKNVAVGDVWSCRAPEDHSHHLPTAPLDRDKLLFQPCPNTMLSLSLLVGTALSRLSSSLEGTRTATAQD